MLLQLDKNNCIPKGVYEGSVLPMCTSDMEFKITTCNKAFEEFIGFDARELKGRGVVEITDMDYTASSVEYVSQLIKKKSKIVIIPKVYLRKDGSKVSALSAVVGHYDPDEGRYIGSTAVIADLTSDVLQGVDLTFLYERMQGCQENLRSEWAVMMDLIYIIYQRRLAQTLKKRTPELTTHEILQCALATSTHSDAILTNILGTDIESTQASWQIIGEKLGLESTREIMEYLSSIESE